MLGGRARTGYPHRRMVGEAKVHFVHVIDTTVVIELETALSPMLQAILDGLTKDAENAWARFAKGVP